MSKITIEREEIRQLTSNRANLEDYFLMQKNGVSYWVVDPENKLKGVQLSDVNEITGTVIVQEDNGKMRQKFVVKGIELDSGQEWNVEPFEPDFPETYAPETPKVMETPEPEEEWYYLTNITKIEFDEHSQIYSFTNRGNTYFTTDPNGYLKQAIKDNAAVSEVALDSNSQIVEVRAMKYEQEEEKRPDYTGWTDEAIAADILVRRKKRESSQGSPFVLFRKGVVESQRERQKQFIKANKRGSRETFEDVEIDEEYQRQLMDVQHQLERRIGQERMLGDGAGRLDRSPDTDGKGNTWGTPKVQY